MKPYRNGRRRVYLHIGAPKSGTTFLQSVLWNNRETLRDEGVLYPGTHFLSHTHAALDLQQVDFAGHKDPLVPGAWSRLVAEMREWDGISLVSQEIFSPARPEAVEEAMRALDFAEVHVIYTARDLRRQIPAAWQEDVKNRNVLTFEEFLAGLKAPADERCPLTAGFWRMQDGVDVLRRWGAHLPPERVHVVTVPHPGKPRGLLWERFRAVTGIPSGACDTTGAVPNGSLGVVETNLLRRLNTALTDEVGWPVYNDCVTGLLAIDTLGARDGRIRIELPRADEAWVHDRCGEQIEGLKAAGYDIVGDLAELAPAPAVHPEARHPDQAADEEMLAPAVESLAALVTRLQHRRDEFDLLDADRDRLSREAERLRREVERLGQELGDTATERDGLRGDLGRAVADGERLSAELRELREYHAKPIAKLAVHRMAARNRLARGVLIAYWRTVEWLRGLRA